MVAEASQDEALCDPDIDVEMVAEEGHARYHAVKFIYLLCVCGDLVAEDDILRPHRDGAALINGMLGRIASQYERANAKLFSRQLPLIRLVAPMKVATNSVCGRL